MREATILGLIVIALLLGYGLAYAVLLEPAEFYSCAHPYTLCSRDPEYRCNYAPMKWFFAPAAWIDRRVRPDYWQWVEGVSWEEALRSLSAEFEAESDGAKVLGDAD